MNMQESLEALASAKTECAKVRTAVKVEAASASADLLDVQACDAQVHTVRDPPDYREKSPCLIVNSASIFSRYARGPSSRMANKVKARCKKRAPEYASSFLSPMLTQIPLQSVYKLRFG
jgi:hypothetical protein